MAEKDSGGIYPLCCLLILIIFIGALFLNGGGSTTTNEIVSDTTPEPNGLDILNYTNITIKPSKVTFFYYDHNTTKYNGCYGLNYTILTDSEGNNYMLDHAESDLLAEKTNNTFTYKNGIGLVYDNNTDTEIYKTLGYYYVHEIRDDNQTVIKSVANFTLDDTSHEPEIIPGDWLFVYYDHNSSKYEGDEGLYYAVFNNTIGNKEENITIFTESKIIGLAYYSNGDFDMYRYGFKHLNLKFYNNSGHSHYAVMDTYESIELPNGTRIKIFSIEDDKLTQDQKDFITNYESRIDDVRHKQQLDAIDRAAYDIESSYRHYSKPSSHYSYYSGTNGVGVIYTP